MACATCACSNFLPMQLQVEALSKGWGAVREEPRSQGTSKGPAAGGHRDEHMPESMSATGICYPYE